MNQLCKVCDEPAAGYHFGAFTCEGCKSFFGRTYNNLSQVHECKNGGSCVINKQNRTSCKACRLKKCLVVGMSKSGSRYGRRSNWFKIHCLLQEQAASLNKTIENRTNGPASLSETSITNVSLDRNNDDTKPETTVLSSPDSIQSDSSVDVARRGLSSLKDLSRDIEHDTRIPDDTPARDFIANWGLYNLNPSLSLLQASQFYSRLYPSMLYSNLAAHPQLLMQNPNRSPPPYSLSIPPRVSPLPSVSPVSSKAEHRTSSVYSGSPDASPHHGPPTPPFSLFANLRAMPFVAQKREAESPVDEIQFNSPKDSDQDGPIDLRIKRRRVSNHHTQDPTTPPRSPEFSPIQVPSIPATITPVDLTTKA